MPLAKLSGGVARISVRAATKTEMKEKKARLDDALHACLAMAEKGILPGGGVAMLRALPTLGRLKPVADETIGIDIVCRDVPSQFVEIPRPEKPRRSVRHEKTL